MAGSPLHLEYHGAAARQRLAELVVSAKREDLLAPVTVVVPTQYAGLSLRRSLAAERGISNIRFMVLARLAEHLGAPALARQGKAPLTPLAELAAIRAASLQMASRTPLGLLARHPGLHQALRNTFRELTRLSTDDIGRIENMDPLRAQVVQCYRLFRDSIARMYDREEQARVAARSVAQRDVESALRDIGTIVFHLVQDLTPGETSLLMSVARAHPCAVVLGLTGNEEADHLALQLASRLEPVLGPPVASPQAAVRQVVAQHIVSAPDAQEEVRWVLRHIVHSAEGGVPFHRMAILYRHREPYGPLVSGQLRLAGIPAAGPDPRLLRDTPAGKLLILLYSIIDSDFSRESVARWIAEAPVGTRGGGPASAQLLSWETVSRMAGVVRGVSNWLTGLDRYRDNIDRQLREAEDLEEATPARLSGLRELRASADRLKSFIKELEARTAPPDETSWRALAQWGKGLLREYAFKPQRWPEEHRDSFDQVMAKLDDMAGQDDVEPKTDLAGFFLMLGDVLGVSSGRLGQYDSGVFVGDVASAQAMDFDTIYLVGMAEGSFPPRVRDDPMLPDRVRQTLAHGEVVPLRHMRLAEERRLFLAALASGGHRVLTYPRADTAGQRGQAPSPWLIEAAERLYGDGVSSSDLTRLASERWLSVVESHEGGLEHARDLAPADLHDFDVASVARWRSTGRPLDGHFLADSGGPLHCALRLARARQSTALTVWDGRLSDLAGKSRGLKLVSGSELSPTRLERWAACPFRYFLGDILGLSTLASPEELLTITPVDRGVLIHRILERLVTASRERGELPKFGEPWSDSHRRALMEIAEEEFGNAEVQGIAGSPVLWIVVRDEIREDLATFLEEDNVWRAEHQSRPDSVEQRFGYHRVDSLPPLEMTLDTGVRVLFRGLIDRVDISAGGAEGTVIDYKSGSIGPYDDMKSDPLGAGRHLQLPIYAMAVRSANESLRNIEGQYWFVTATGNFQRRTVRLSEVEGWLTGIIGTVASGIEQGLFPANPGAPADRGRFQNCRNCDFDRICPSNRDWLWDRKRQDPDLAGYVQLAEH